MAVLSGLWDLNSMTVSPALGAQSLNHWLPGKSHVLEFLSHSPSLLGLGGLLFVVIFVTFWAEDRFEISLVISSFGIT